MGKTIIVTGSTGNLGLAVVKKFLEEGDSVIGTVNNAEDLSQTFSHDKFDKMPLDATNEEDAHKFVANVIDKYGSPDAAILTVGGFAMGNIEETKTSDIGRQYKLNFETAYNVVRPVFLEMMRQNKGRIFLIGSRPGLDAAKGKGMISYSLTKSLLFHLAELLNHEAKGKDVVSIVVVPITIDTPQNRKSMPSADFSSWVTPEKIAGVIHYYTTDAASALREPVIKLYNKS
jgi:NAD(P)-dependent dehydrogenase (short-subunit alcohol dehydrogenase family)